jgi:hypothetical protein
MSRKTTTPDLAMSRRVGLAVARATWLTTGSPPTPIVRISLTATMSGPRPLPQALGDTTAALTTLLTAIKAAGLTA